MSTAMSRLIQMAIANHTKEELAIGWLRYAVLRKLSMKSLAELHKKNLMGKHFDALIDEILNEVPQALRNDVN